ncbi:MAG: hypothetical protein AB7F19_03335 [Candidatus Babeliales bacterium]
MLKKNILILLLGAVCGASSAFGMDPTSPLLCRDINRAIAPEEQRRMEPVQESEDYSTITTQDGKDFKVPDKLLKLSETIKNLLEDAANDTVHNAIPLPTITASIWQKIHDLLPLVARFKDQPDHQEEKNIIKQEIIAKIQTFDIVAFIDFIIAANYLDIPLLLELALTIDAAKEMNVKKIPFDKIASLPPEIRNLIIANQMVCILGPMHGKQGGVIRNEHTNRVRAISITDDGMIVSGSEDGTLCIWNRDRILHAICRGHTDCVNVICITRNNKIVSGSRDGTIRIWNIDGTQHAVCNGHTDAIKSMCITDDDTTIISGSCDTTVRVWNMNGVQSALCEGHTGFIASVCVTQDGKTIVSNSDDGSVRIWNLDGTQRTMFNGYTNSVNSLCVTSENKIVSPFNPKTICIWDIQGNQYGIYSDSKSYVMPLCITPDDKIVLGLQDNTVRILDIKGNQLAVCNGHTDVVYRVCVTHDNKIVSASFDRTICVWNTQGKKLVVCKGHEKTVQLLCATSDNKLVSAANDNTIRIWDIDWLFKKLSVMNTKQAQAIWNNLQRKYKTRWDGILEILNKP